MGVEEQTKGALHMYYYGVAAGQLLPVLCPVQHANVTLLKKKGKAIQRKYLPIARLILE